MQRVIGNQAVQRMSRTDSPPNRACPPVVQQAGVATPTLQRQPSSKGVAELELELRAKMEERAMLARMLQEESDKIAADVFRRRIQTGSKKEEAKLKAGPQGDLQRWVPVDVLKNKIDIVRTKDGFTLNVRIELSYPGNTYSEGWVLSANHIPSIKQALRAAWSVDFTEGAYAGKRFRLEPRIEFRPNTRRADSRALQFIVRKAAGGDTVAQWHLRRDQLQPGPFEGRPGRHRRTRALPPFRVDRRCVLHAPADGDERTWRAVQRRTP